MPFVFRRELPLQEAQNFPLRFSFFFRKARALRCTRCARLPFSFRKVPASPENRIFFDRILF
jgi:hypothetical protein